MSDKKSRPNPPRPNPPKPRPISRPAEPRNYPKPDGGQKGTGPRENK